ncbi:hypothetical protein [Streptomyces sp. NPDC052693]|uniref:hypothetical protein n=1 Tax=Streptomyces sp. NPDC052693 TaxID=3155814 RepID=UPI0034268953
MVTAGRLRRLEREAEQAGTRAREVQAQADTAWGRHVRELFAVTDRAERAEAATAEVGAILARAVDELSAAQQELLLRDIEIRRLREELVGARREGSWLVLLLHRGEPHSIHRNQGDAHAYVATLGIPVQAWEPSDERPASEVLWRLVPFTRDEAVNGFRSVSVPSPTGWEGAA